MSMKSVFLQGSSHGKPSQKSTMITEEEQAVVKPHTINTELQTKQSKLTAQNSDAIIDKNEEKDEDDDSSSDDDDSSSDDDSDDDDDQTESGDDDDEIHTNGNNNALRSKENLRLTHNEFSQVGSKGIITKSEKDESGKETRVTTHDFDKERKMLTFSDSEYNESENEETNTKYSGYEMQEIHSPSKVMMRKVAVKEDRKTGVDTRILLQKLSGNTVNSDNDLLTNLNASAFAPRAKSPIVISKEKIITTKPLPSRHNLQEDKFVYHSDSDSNGNKLKASLSDDENSDTSETEIKTKSKIFNERKTLQFDDDDEWEDKMPCISRTRQTRTSSGNEDHDRTLVEESEKKNQNIPGKSKNYFMLSDLQD